MHTPDPVLLVVAPLPVRFGFRVKVVVEVRRKLLEDLLVAVGVDRKRVVLLPRRHG